MIGGVHHNYDLVLEAMHDPSTWACIHQLLKDMGANLFPVADDRFRSPGEETIREAIELHPGADRRLVRAYFTFRPACG